MIRTFLIFQIFISISIVESDTATISNILRTPDSRFENLQDYPFNPNYVIVDGLRIHYLDEGSSNGEIIFLLHGEPTWSYLYRKMIPILVDSGYRVIVPDMIGFGKSDKFLSKNDYSYDHHIHTMKELIKQLDLNEITFFGQDWGGLVGLRVVAEMPDRFSSVAVSNTGLPAAEGINAWLIENIVKFLVWWFGPVTFDELRTAGIEVSNNPDASPFDGAIVFIKWIAHSFYEDDMDVTGIIQMSGRLDLSDEELRAYNAPYPSGEYKSGAHIFPYLIPTQLSENEYYWKNVFEKWDKPFLVAYGSDERTTIGFKKDFINRIPDPIDVTLEGVGHFCQEEAGEELAILLDQFIKGELYE